MSAQHTPGPWDWFTASDRVYLATPNRGRLYVMGFARQGMRGGVPQFAHWDGIAAGAARERLGGILVDGPFLRNGSLHPDARLIAAAPELLAACQLLVAQYDASGDFTMGGKLTNQPFSLARAAIAKATGVQSDEARYVEGLQR